MDLVYNRRSGFISFIFMGWMDTIENISRITESEIVYGDERDEHNRSMMLRPERKREALIKNLANKYTKPPNLGFDRFGALN